MIKQSRRSADSETTRAGENDHSRKVRVEGWTTSGSLADTALVSASKPTGDGIDLYYSVGTRSYWRRIGDGRFIPISLGDARMYLRSLGYSPAIQDGESASDLDRALIALQNEFAVDYAAPLAGYDAGFYKINGGNVLVTNSSKLIAPASGDTPLLNTVINSMFVDGAVDQRPYLFGWLKCALEMYRAKEWSPGQVLVLVGPADCGKSLFQRLLTILFGGRSANPFRNMVGHTEFNRDLFAAEHLMIEDEVVSRDGRARLNLASAIKRVAANRDHNCHGKHENALTLTPLWRMSISLNDDPSKLEVLPPLTPDVVDKLIILKVAKSPMPMPTNTEAEKRVFWDALVNELPAFTNFLLSWDIPPELQSPRFGITHFHHPDVVQALNELEPHVQLLNLIDVVIVPRLKGPWHGTAAELTAALTSHKSVVAREAKQLLRHPSACGAILGVLSRHHPDRVTKGPLIHGIRKWVITPP